MCISVFADKGAAQSEDVVQFFSNSPPQRIILNYEF